MNLISSPWIPVLDADGRTREIPLREAFERSGEIRDLACGPAERISLLRLLICIAHASRETPDRDDSPEWADFAGTLASAATAYLDRTDIAPHFELFGDGPRFLQLPTKKSGSMATSKLFFHLASGNNPTHNDHKGGENCKIAPPSLALALLTFQNFSPLLGRGFKGRGLCVEGNAAHAFQYAPTLSATIAANCLSLDAISALCPEEKLGRPVWERPPAPPFPPKAPETRNATHSYLGRLTPLARLVWLVDQKSVILESGPDFPDTPALREPSTCVIKKKNDEYSLLGLRLGRAVWRDLPAFAMNQQEGGCPTLRRGDSGDRNVFVGGLVTDFKAKVENSVSSFFTNRLAVPAAMFSDKDEARDARNDYALAIRAAELWSTSLWKALGSYYETLKVDPKQTASFRSLAQSDYWSFIEQSLPALFDILRTGDYPEEPLDHPYAKSAWHRALRDASNRAYRLHAHRANARQLEAFASGLRALWPKNPSKSKNKSA